MIRWRKKSIYDTELHHQVLAIGRSIWRLGYAKTLGMDRGIEITRDTEQDGLEGVYDVPENLCVGGSSGNRYLPCSVAAGIFDEFSTLGMMTKDRTHRPGVSISLSTELVGRRIGPGDKLILKSRSPRIGRSIGFAEFWAEREGTKEVVVRGRHIKYLPMGSMWDALMTWPLSEVAARIHQKDVDARMKDEKRTKGIPPGQTLADQFPLVGLQTEVTTEAGAKITRGNATLSIEKNMINYLNSLHGGAVSAAAEIMANVTLEAAGKESPQSIDEQQHWVRWMETHFLQAQRGTTTVESEHSGTTTDIRFVGKKGELKASTRLMYSAQ